MTKLYIANVLVLLPAKDDDHADSIINDIFEDVPIITWEYPRDPSGNSIRPQEIVKEFNLTNLFHNTMNRK